MDLPLAPSRDRVSPSHVLTSNKIVAVLRAADAGAYERVIDVLVDSGIRSIELTLTTPGTLEMLPELLRRAGSDTEIGVGTVTCVEEAEQALNAGASYLVTPFTNPDVIATAVRAGRPIFPGALTPTEVHTAWAAGATAVKIFPAETVGAAYGAHLLGPFPALKFLPSGGIRMEDIGPWLRSGAIAVSLGGPLLGDALRGGSLDGLAARAQAAIDAVSAA
ncbi:bifunctional 4-hydroxy-2-oxoglutarate aldolase/2-dehydro-3-deoxy-phosphogluconate aldolase [Arthrobacter oryzae]|uniref:2-dehydro-3-deoxyphosphogluconate aldolase n=1 Tax=Arthrobacter oryzae TaxID=409290 RepID=A0A3N0BMS7_9MICC|nr:bifunctional 4-hydroxy-2-oxoglutarate aldolase/2-dehydro-3-deoxy-phosphogluconate aldolase [Arthrobacter oryzae]RNL50046.1 2-dehydro-3-deoxyphosphogluconate aldolase [Arthrobacter oryzae]